MSEWLRELQNSELWQDKPFAKGQAWIDMVLSAERKEDGWYFEFTQRELAERWGWSTTKIREFIIWLEQQGKIIKKTKEKTKKKTMIKLENTRDCDISKTKEKTKKKTIEKTKENDNENQLTVIDAEHDNIPDSEIYKRIVDYLNNRCGTNYKYTTQTTKRSIHARLAEGFTEEDFYTVIDKKAKEWIGTEMERYLTPTTLFSGKFEGYLNQVIVNRENKNTFNKSRDEKFRGLMEQIRRDRGYVD